MITSEEPRATATPERIDVHAHFLPDFYRDALRDAGVVHPDGMTAVPSWSEDTAIVAMDELHVSTAFLSISSPGVHWSDDIAARKLARRVNEEGNRLRATYPNRFGLFASVPLPDIGGAIVEARYALDVLGADAITVESNHAGLYLGDRGLDPFYAVLEERRAVLFIHPTSPACSACDSLTLGYPSPMLEFMFETTRTITNMILSGVTVRYPNIRIIVPHAGAALPVLASRIELFSASLVDGSVVPRPDFRAELRKLYYDLAGAPLPELIDALTKIADPQRIFYGSDWPFTPLETCKTLATKLDASLRADERSHNAFMRGNATRLFPTLARPLAPAARV